MVGYQLDDEPNFYMGKWLDMHHFHPLRKGWNWGSRMIKYICFFDGGNWRLVKYDQQNSPTKKVFFYCKDMK